MTDAAKPPSDACGSRGSRRAQPTRRSRGARGNRTARDPRGPGEPRRTRGARGPKQRAPRRSAERAAAFDAFYKDSRDRLLVQTLALTGDLTAARSAVRDAYVVAWHHWRKIARQSDPEYVVRGYAYRFGLRRRSARPWGRRKDGDESARATLDALASISLHQRKAVILTQLAGVDMAQAAREIGVPIESAERELAAGAALFAHDREIPTSQIHQTLVDLEGMTHAVTWPRVTIIRRAGGARRRAHTLIGATAAVAIFAAAGAVITDGSGLRPTLDRQVRQLAAARTSHDPGVGLPATGMLTTTALSQHLHGRGWTLDGTTDNSSGNGLVQPCQGARYADPNGTAALVRHFHSGQGAKAAAYVQTAEASRAKTSAESAYRTALGWFTSCEPSASQDITKVPETHMVSTAQTPGVGDESAVVVLQTAKPRSSYVVGLARTGQFTTTTSLRAKAAPGKAEQQDVADLLGSAVDRLCHLPGGGACAPTKVKVGHSPAFPGGRDATVLTTVDLPLLGVGHGRLVGTAARPVSGERGDTGVVGCDVVRLVGSYAGSRIGSNLTRSFVFVGGNLPKETGLTQVVGTLPAGKATAFADQMGKQLGKCPQQNKSLGTHVDQLADHHTHATAVQAWRMSTELSGNRTVEYDVAIVRSGGSLSQLIYVSAPGARMADGDFVDLAKRALERLPQLG
ncbi:MAG: hypothetical protein FWE71_14825 [Nocardioidaceae bacterium]|nr:hypothetical protein [Nocardioidaceae bacterium]MCL2612418.1 hypothetical protein [Nocardioidaceae bacterium]